jgi:chemotaxis response regulator CheB
MVSIEPGNREGPPGSLTGSPRDIVVIGASRGGVEALRGIVSALPPDLQSTLLIVVHTSPTHVSLLPDILSRAGPLPAEHGRNGMRIERGRIYVAPPDHHMTVGPIGFIRLDQGPTLFRRWGCEKVAPAGQFEAGGRVPVTCLP